MKRKERTNFMWTEKLMCIFFFLLILILPELLPRTCTRLGSSGGVNVGAGWWSSERFYIIFRSKIPFFFLLDFNFIFLFDIWTKTVNSLLLANRTNRTEKQIKWKTNEMKKVIENKTQKHRLVFYPVSLKLDWISFCFKLNLYEAKRIALVAME